MNRQLSEHPNVFLDREFTKLRKQETKKFEENFTKSAKDKFIELKGKIKISDNSTTFQSHDKSFTNSSSTTTKRKTRATDIKIESDLSLSTKSQRIRKSSSKTDGDKEHPIELQESSSSSSSSGGSFEDQDELNNQDDDDYEVENNFEILQDQPVNQDPPAVALAGNGSTIISDTEDNVGADCLSVSVASAIDASKVLKSNATKKRKAKEQRKGPRRKRIPRYNNPFFSQETIPFNETHPGSSSSDSDYEDEV